MHKVKSFVSIIIANYNGEKYLKTCLNSVLSSTHKDFELILVDDGSSDNSKKMIKNYMAQDKRIKLISNSSNLGAAGSRNKAIKVSTGEIIVFLDNDTEVDKYWLTHLLHTLKDEKVGAAQSLLVDFENRNEIQMAGGKLIPHVGWLAPFYHGRKIDDVKDELQEDNIVAISAALAVKKEVIETVRGFDELEAVTTEDLDFCWRIWLAGYKIKLSPKSIVYHYTKKVSERDYLKKLQNVYFHLAKNSYRSIIKNYEVINILKYLPTSIVINTGRGIAFIIMTGNSSALVGSMRGLMWNIRVIGDTLRERREVNNTRKYSDKELFKLMMNKESLMDVYNKYFAK